MKFYMFTSTWLNKSKLLLFNFDISPTKFRGRSGKVSLFGVLRLFHSGFKFKQIYSVNATSMASDDVQV